VQLCLVCNIVLAILSTGYFIHDLIDIVVNGQSSNMWEVIPHHIAVLIHYSVSRELTSDVWNTAWNISCTYLCQKLLKKLKSNFTVVFSIIFEWLLV